jgi:phosphoribosylformylglycinamidine synthase
MAARGGVGVELDTSKVPLREPGMSPYEILLSESQERMLLVVEPHRIPEVEAICAKWEQSATAIGRITDDGLFRVIHEGRTVAAIPGERLVNGVPIYHPEAAEAPEAIARRSATPAAGPKTDAANALLLLLDDPTVASKRWVFDQYDSTVQANTVLGPGGDAGVFLVEGTRFGMAVSVDCPNRYVALDPYQGGRMTVAEAARNVACTGAVPLGITNCLNFGNPDKPEIFFQFKEAVRGMGDACRAFDTPVTGGNVSLYNESPTGAIDPTPTVGMVGLLEDVTTRVPSAFQQPGDLVAVVGETRGHLGGSLYWWLVRDFLGGPPPPCDLDRERALQRFLVAAARERLLRSAHDCADGGLAVAVAEACIGGPYANATLGAGIHLVRPAGISLEAMLYGEDGARAVVSFDPVKIERVRALAAEHGVPFAAAGTVGTAGGDLRITIGTETLTWSTGALRRTYVDAIPRRMAA